MEKDSGLNDFFASQKTGKSKKKGRRGQEPANDDATEEKKVDSSAAASVAKDDDKKQSTEKQDANQSSKAASKNANTFIDSDEEADADVVLDVDQKMKLKDTVESKAAASKKNQQKLEDKGWNADNIFRRETREEPKQETAQTQGPKKQAGVDGINFGGAKPMFTRQSKGIIDKQSFPEFGDMAKNKGDKNVLKKDSTYMMDSGSGSAAAAPSSQSKESMQMPIFKGRLKLDSGVTADEIQKSKQNYDMSTLKMSAAASKTKDPNYEGRDGGQSGRGRGGGGRGGRGGRAQQNDFGDDDDFEVVTEKKRGNQRKHNYGDSDISFGDKPNFERAQRGGRYI